MITVREGDPSDAGEIANLFTLVFGRSIAEPEIRWKYAHSWGRASFVAEDHGRIVAHYAALPRQWTMGQRTGTAMVATDAMTAPEHQGRGLFKRLVALAHGSWRAQNVDLVFGLPNSARVAKAQQMVRTAGVELARWQAHLELPSRFERLGAPPALMNLVGPAWRGAWQLWRRPWLRTGTPCALKDAEEIAAFNRGLPMATSLSRDAAWLSWRYLEHPLGLYRLVGVRAPDGALAAWCALRSPGRDPEVGVIAELHGSDWQSSASLLSRLLEQRPAGVRRFETHRAGASNAAFLAAGFWIRRQGAPLYAAALSLAADEVVFNPRDLVLCGGDFDLV